MELGLLLLPVFLQQRLHLLCEFLGFFAGFFGEVGGGGGVDDASGGVDEEAAGFVHSVGGYVFKAAALRAYARDEEEVCVYCIRWVSVLIKLLIEVINII